MLANREMFPDLQELIARLIQPWMGASWESFVIEEIARELNAYAGVHLLYHFRTSDQYEIDLLIDFGDEVWGVET